MKLSVIIVNYNVKHFLEQCLQSVHKAIKNIITKVKADFNLFLLISLNKLIKVMILNINIKL